MKKMALALGLGLFVGANAQATVNDEDSAQKILVPVSVTAEYNIQAQKDLLAYAGYTLKQTYCNGKTKGGKYGDGTHTYTPKYIELSYCTIQSPGSEGEGEPTKAFPCSYGSNEWDPSFDTSAKVVVSELTYLNAPIKGGPGEQLGFTSFTVEDIVGTFDEGGVNFIGRNDGDMSAFLKTYNDSAAVKEKPLFRVEGVAGEDENKYQEMRDSVECQTVASQEVPTVETTSLKASLLYVVDSGAEKTYYFKNEEGNKVYLDFNEDSELYTQVSDQLNEGLEFTFTGKVLGPNALGGDYEMVVEDVTYAVPAEQPLVP